MKINFVDASPYEFVSIYRTGRYEGRLVMNKKFIKNHKLNKGDHFKIGFDKTDNTFKTIGVFRSEPTEITAELKKIGHLYCLNLLRPLEKYNIDFRTKVLRFILEEEINNTFILKLQHD